MCTTKSNPMVIQVILLDTSLPDITINVTTKRNTLVFRRLGIGLPNLSQRNASDWIKNPVKISLMVLKANCSEGFWDLQCRRTNGKTDTTSKIFNLYDNLDTPIYLSVYKVCRGACHVRRIGKSNIQNRRLIQICLVQKQLERIQ